MKNYKTGLIVFLILAIIISLFPPFQWGNEYLKTLLERKKNNEIADYLPLKRFDFIFSQSKKWLPIKSIYFEKRIYENEKLDVDTTDAYKVIKSNGIDTVYKFDEAKFESDRTNERKTIQKVSSKISEHKILDHFNPFANKKYSKEDIERAEKSFAVYDKKYQVFEGIRKYTLFKISKPNYYSLKRELLVSELVIEYLLAGFIALFIQITIIFAKKKTLNKKSIS